MSDTTHSIYSRLQQLTNLNASITFSHQVAGMIVKLTVAMRPPLVANTNINVDYTECTEDISPDEYLDRFLATCIAEIMARRNSSQPQPNRKGVQANENNEQTQARP